MIRAILLACFAITASAIPVNPSVAPLLPGQRGVLPVQRVPPVQATNQILDAQVLPPISPNLQQPQPGTPQLLDSPQSQNYPLSPQGGTPLMIPLVPHMHGPQPVNQPMMPQQPLIFSPYGYFPMFSSPHGNQMFSPYGFPMILDGVPQQTPQISVNQPPNNPVSPVEKPSGPDPSGNTPEPTQQEQNHQIVYMLPSMNSPLGGLSSEELEMAARMGRLSVYVSGVQTNMPSGAVQPVPPVSKPTGLANPEQPELNLPSAGLLPTVRTSVPKANSVPAGLERPEQDMATGHTPCPLEHQPAQ
ncbi:hypothetical protein LDENG_00193580 [Lucifuga dentata]|nr:hypothetical protein LDENG_00193580 [Lucifuga dentata]